MNTKVDFGSLPVGAQFSLVSDPEARYGYSNIKVHPSIMVGREHFGAFNVINLRNGEPRTFHDEQQVYPIS